MKICSICKKELEDEKFPFKNKLKNKRQSTCRECHKVYVNNHYKNNKETYKKKARKNTIQYIKNYNEYKRTLYCTDCNISFKDYPGLCQFHHIDPSNKDIEPSLLNSSKQRFFKEIEKCIPLCANCHIIRHYKLKLEEVV